MGLALALVAAGVLARLHLRGGFRHRLAAARNPYTQEAAPDPPLEFLDPADDFSV
jgi:hypothetical protein